MTDQIYIVKPQQNIFDALLTANGTIDGSFEPFIAANNDTTFPDWSVDLDDEVDRGTTIDLNFVVLTSYKKRGHLPVNSSSIFDTVGDFVPVSVGIGVAIIGTNFEIG